MPSLDPSKRRRRTILAAALMLAIFSFAVINAVLPREGALRAVDIVRLSGFIALALVLALRSTTNFTLLRRNPELDDELSRANRSSAAVLGFWVLLLTTIAAFVGSLFVSIMLTEAAPLILGAGAVAAGMRFASLEAKGERIA
jgi:hypothetical protein